MYVDEPRNLLTLRANLYKLFNSRLWIPVPVDGKWAIWAATLHHNQLCRVFHNVEMQALNELRRCLFARFAWTISGIAEAGRLGPGPWSHLVNTRNKAMEMPATYQKWRTPLRTPALDCNEDRS